VALKQACGLWAGILMSQASCCINCAVAYYCNNHSLSIILLLHEMHIGKSVHVLYLHKNDSAGQIRRIALSFGV
jgi:hypothetical protein